MFAVMTVAGVVWNVITVSLRQTIIPDRLLGRVELGLPVLRVGDDADRSGRRRRNGVAGRAFRGREFGLRLPWLVSGAAYVAVIIYAVPRLTTEKVEAARAEGIAAKAAEGAAGQPGEADEEIAGEAISEAGIVTAPPPIDLDEAE